MKNEPAMVFSSILAVVIAAVALVTEFGVDLTSGQQTAIVGFVGAVGALITGRATRSLVTPVAKGRTAFNSNDLDGDGRDDKTGRFLPRT